MSFCLLYYKGIDYLQVMVYSSYCDRFEFDSCSYACILIVILLQTWCHVNIEMNFARHMHVKITHNTVTDVKSYLYYKLTSYQIGWGWNRVTVGWN